MKNSADLEKPAKGPSDTEMAKVSPLRKWLSTRGMVIGLMGALFSVLGVIIFGVNFVTLFALALFGGLILAGVLAFSANPVHARHKHTKGGG